jgi:hypothetical protein
MTYSPGGPGYPPGQPTTQFAAPTQQVGTTDSGPSKLPLYLTIAIAALGLAVYLSSYGPMFTTTISDLPQLGSISGTSPVLSIAIILSVLAALLAGVSLLPKQDDRIAVVAALSVLSFLLVIAETVNASGAAIDWGLYLVIAFTALQAVVAVGALLLAAGVISAPAPRPKHEQQYGQYGAPGQYYGQPGQPGPQHGGPPQQQGPQQHAPQQQRPGYPSQYGGYPPGPSAGGFSAPGPQGGPPTPPTGFPTYGQPHQSSSAPTTQVPAQPQPSSSSPHSGPAPS